MEERYPTLGNLMPRDVVSREEYKMIHEEGYNKIYLDMTSINEDTWNKKLSDLRKEIIEYFNKDPKTTPIEVEPGIHFFMGGFKVNNNHETSIRRIYAAGECAAIYHGANRLGGNSLLGALYGGSRAALTVNENYEYFESASPELVDFIDSSEVFKNELKDILYSGLSIKRNEAKIDEAIKNIRVLRDKSNNEADIKRINVALAMLNSAKARKESRGSHFRSDFPDTLDEYKKTTVSELVNNEIVISFESIDED